MARRTVRVEGLERLKAKIARLPSAAKKKMAAKNEESARLMWGAARIRLTRGDPERGHLEDTLKVVKGATETGYLVRVGGPGNPYPLSLEVGHRASDGSHVPAEPFWYPSKREVAAKHKRGMAKLLDDVVSEIIR
jgi:hypothetical protein